MNMDHLVLNLLQYQMKVMVQSPETIMIRINEDKEKKNFHRLLNLMEVLLQFLFHLVQWAKKNINSRS
jgi:hypothetical protein